ncbi:MAG TPA: ATP-binding protein, partial [Stenomitos sp.]
IRLLEQRTEQLERTNAQHEAALEELRRLSRIKDEFLSVVSHELRTPLSSILGYGEFLEDELPGDLSGDQPEYVARIMQAARQMGMLVDDLLDLTRIASGTMRLDLREVALPDLMVQAAAIAAPLIEPKGQRLHLEVSGVSTLVADPGRLLQVLLNLVSNAAKFSPDGSPIYLKAEGTPSGVAISVVDQGVGIDPSEHDAIFERFYQSDRSLTRQAGGVGLGLSIVKHLVELHHGKVQVESEPGTGATFRVLLPVAVPAVPAAV